MLPKVDDFILQDVCHLVSDHTILLIWIIKIFLYSSSVYPRHLFLMSSASVRFMPFLSFIVPIFAWNVPFVSLNFLEEISSLSHSIVFLYFFTLITEESFSLLAILYNSAFRWIPLSFSPLPLASLLFSAIFKAFSDNHFAFLHFFFLGMILICVQYHEPLSIVHQTLCLSNLVP